MRTVSSLGRVVAHGNRSVAAKITPRNQDGDSAQPDCRNALRTSRRRRRVRPADGGRPPAARRGQGALATRLDRPSVARSNRQAVDAPAQVPSPMVEPTRRLSPSGPKPPDRGGHLVCAGRTSARFASCHGGPSALRSRAEQRLATGSARNDRRNAPSAKGLEKVPARPGRAVRAARLARELHAALARADPPRALTVPTRRVAPRVTLADLVRHDRAYPIIDRAAFRLPALRAPAPRPQLPDRGRTPGLGTPASPYDIQWQEVNPPWRVPNSPWAGALAGRVIPPGPRIRSRRAGWPSTAARASTAPTTSPPSATPPHTAASACSSPTSTRSTTAVPVGSPVYVANALAPRRRHASDQSAKSARLTQPV